MHSNTHSELWWNPPLLFSTTTATWCACLEWTSTQEFLHGRSKLITTVQLYTLIKSKLSFWDSRSFALIEGQEIIDVRVARVTCGTIEQFLVVDRCDINYVLSPSVSMHALAVYINICRIVIVRGCKAYHAQWAESEQAFQFIWVNLIQQKHILVHKYILDIHTWHNCTCIHNLTYTM